MPGELLQVDAGDLTFDVRADGPEDGRPVLLLHGFPETSLSWAAVTPRLTEAGLRTYAPDQLGYSPGARPADVGAYALPNLAQVTADLMTAIAGPRGPDDGDGGPPCRRRRSRLGRQRGLGAGRLAPRPGPLADRGVGTAPHRLHRGLARGPRAAGALGLHPAVLAGGQGRGGAAGRRRPPAAPDARRAVRDGDTGRGGRRVRGGAVRAGRAHRRAQLVPGDELQHDGGPGRGADDVRVERRRRRDRPGRRRGLRHARHRRLPVRGALRGHPLDPRAGPRPA